MNEHTTSDRSFGTFTVLDMLLFVVACSVSILLIRLRRPAVPTLDDYLMLTAYCGPAGLSLFGPWAVRRQFIDSGREELQVGEWLWIALGGAWVSATPLFVAMGGTGLDYFSGLVAAVVFVPALVALVQSIPGATRRPWTHWAGILLCLLHATPALIRIGPVLWTFLDMVVSGAYDTWGELIFF